MPVRLPLDLPDEVPACHKLIGEMARDIEGYQKRIDVLTRRLFGRSSEKMDPNGLTFFGQDQLAAPQPAPEAPAPPAESKKPRRRHPGRKPLPADLPRQRVVHDVPEEQKVCPECGAQKKRIGEDTSEQLDYIPASIVVLEHVRPKYACPRCQGHVAQAEMPPQPIDKGRPGPGLLAHVLTSKYADHLPLHRQEGILARHGIDLTRSTLCDWTMDCADLLSPIVREMKKEILRSYVLQTDDTGVPVLEPGGTHRGCLWTYLGDDLHPYIVYDFTWTRAREGPKDFLDNFEGYLQADAYSGYDALFETGRIVELACWAHARRKFVDAKPSAPVQANQALLQIRELYAIEKEAGERKPDERRTLRQEKAQPLLDAFADWMRQAAATVLPKSPLGETIAYAQNNWTALRRYTDDGRFAIDNNAAERALRAVVIGRRNYLFCGTETGGRAAAILYSLIQSAKRHHIDPFAYLRDLLARIPTHPQRDIQSLLPDKWKAALIAAAAR
ncbi:MAG: IS66 family transposase [Candidatus Sumerlaeota bacterium]|nr:IS66 family transposase [Candidatus Sumerlaeota bacterium]